MGGVDRPLMLNLLVLEDIADLGVGVFWIYQEAPANLLLERLWILMKV